MPAPEMYDQSVPQTPRSHLVTGLLARSLFGGGNDGKYKRGGRGGGGGKSKRDYQNEEQMLRVQAKIQDELAAAADARGTQKSAMDMANAAQLQTAILAASESGESIRMPGLGDGIVEGPNGEVMVDPNVPGYYGGQEVRAVKNLPDNMSASTPMMSYNMGTQYRPSDDGPGVPPGTPPSGPGPQVPTVGPVPPKPPHPGVPTVGPGSAPTPAPTPAPEPEPQDGPAGEVRGKRGMPTAADFRAEMNALQSQYGDEQGSHSDEDWENYTGRMSALANAHDIVAVDTARKANTAGKKRAGATKVAPYKAEVIAGGNPEQRRVSGDARTQAAAGLQETADLGTPATTQYGVGGRPQPSGQSGNTQGQQFNGQNP